MIGCVQQQAITHEAQPYERVSQERSTAACGGTRLLQMEAERLCKLDKYRAALTQGMLVVVTTDALDAGLAWARQAYELAQAPAGSHGQPFTPLCLNVLVPSNSHTLSWGAL